MNPRIVEELNSMPEKEIVDSLGWEVFLRYKVHSWNWTPSNFKRQFPLTKYLGMTLEEYAEWATKDVIPERIKRVWGR